MVLNSSFVLVVYLRYLTGAEKNPLRKAGGGKLAFSNSLRKRYIKMDHGALYITSLKSIEAYSYGVS